MSSPNTSSTKPRLILLLLLGIFVLSLLALISNHYASFLRSSIKGASTDLSATQIITLTNQVRSQQGLPPLTENHQLTQAAFTKAQHMLQTGNFNHSYTDSGTQIQPWDFITQSGYDYYYAGENLARGFTSSPELLDSWLTSPSHRSNLLSSHYQHIGVAVIEGTFPDKGPGLLVVQILASPQPASLTPSDGIDLSGNFLATTILSPEPPTISLPSLFTSVYPWLIIIILLLLPPLILSARPRSSRSKPSARLWRL